MIAKEDIKRVAIYLRLSRDEEGVGIEKILDNHRKTLTELCKKNKWKYTLYEEIASSQDIDRPQLNAMLDEIKKNKTYDAVVVHAIDRLSRDKLSAAYIENVLRQNDVFLVTPDRVFNWDNDEDNLVLDILEFVAKAEYRNTRRRLINGKSSASKQGFFVHGQPPFGYDKDPNSRILIPNEDRKHVEFIFNSLVDGKSISDVYHELNAMGVKTRDGNGFHFNAILRIVTNEAYTGTLVYNRFMVTEERLPGGKKRTRERPKSEWKYVPDAHEAIIDENTWNKANKIVNTYKFAKPRSKNKIYPTTKLIFCANCGKTQGCQYVPHMDTLYLKVCPNCKNRAYAYEPILKIIKERVSNHIPKILEQIKEFEQNDNSTDLDYKKQQIQKQIEKAQNAIVKARIGYEEDVYTLAEFKATKAKRDIEIEKLGIELRQIEQADPKDKIADLRQIKERVEYLSQNWQCLDGEGLTDEEVNRALHFIVERITWKYDFSGEEPELKITWK